jgi:hypothetical protein
VLLPRCDHYWIKERERGKFHAIISWEHMQTIKNNQQEKENKSEDKNCRIERLKTLFYCGCSASGMKVKLISNLLLEDTGCWVFNISICIAWVVVCMHGELCGSKNIIYGSILNASITLSATCSFFPSWSDFIMCCMSPATSFLN